MLELHFDVEDLLHVEFAPHPAPLMELGLAVATLQRHDDTASFGAWRRERRRRLPRAALPLFGLVPATGAGPLFLDPPLPTAAAGIDAVMSTGYATASRELRRVFSTRPAGPWVRALAASDRGAWSDLHLALRTGLEVLVDPDWERLRRAYAGDIAWRTHLQSTRGLGATLVSLFPGSTWADACLRVPLGHHAEVRLGGRGLTLMPSTVWTGGPLIGTDSRGRPLLLYPAVTALPHTADDDDPDDLAVLLGRTRALVLRCVGEAPATTTTLAHTLAVSPASVSQHTTTLRRARLISSVRDGKQVWHSPTALGSQLLGDEVFAGPSPR